jgi:hypothetical protein
VPTAGAHVHDKATHGSDAVATSLILAEAVKKIGDPDLILTGMASTDGATGVVPAMLAERLGLPQVRLAFELTVEGGTVTIRRDGDVASGQFVVQTVDAAEVSVTRCAASAAARRPSCIEPPLPPASPITSTPRLGSRARLAATRSLIGSTPCETSSGPGASTHSSDPL